MIYELMGRLHAELVGLGERGLSRERGQGTVEYVGLILLLAVVLAGVVAAAKSFKGADSIPKVIIEKLKAAVDGVSPK